MRRRSLLALGVLACVALAPARSADTTMLPGLARAPLSIPIALANGRKATLEGLVVRPDRPGRFPLVVLVHGTPRGDGGDFVAQLQRMSPTALMGPAIAFAQRGYAAVSIMRRGFGRSDGPYAEAAQGPCDHRDYLAAGRRAAEDIAGAVLTLRREPWVNFDRVVLLGWSSGGFAITAAAATKPPGVVAILDFAGGRGSEAPDHSCSPDALVYDIATFGRTARIPALWLYAENDHFIAPTLAHRMYSAYTAAGAPAQLQMLPPFGDDGHMVISSGPTELWWPAVETFLASLHLPTSIVVTLPPLTPLPAPPSLNPLCAKYFAQYNTMRTDSKVFVVSPQGHCTYNWGARTVDDAKADAMSRCTTSWKTCKVYATGQALAPQ